MCRKSNKKKTYHVKTIKLLVCLVNFACTSFCSLSLKNFNFQSVALIHKVNCIWFASFENPIINIRPKRKLPKITTNWLSRVDANTSTSTPTQRNTQATTTSYKSHNFSIEKIVYAKQITLENLHAPQNASLSKSSYCRQYRKSIIKDTWTVSEAKSMASIFQAQRNKKINDEIGSKRKVLQC